MRAARLVPRLNRAKADKLLADFLRSVEEVNAHPDLLHWVTEVRVFGSYLTNSDDLGDIDIAIRKKRRPVSGSLAMHALLWQNRTAEFSAPIEIWRFVWTYWWRDCSKAARGTSRCTASRILMRISSLAA